MDQASDGANGQRHLLTHLFLLVRLLDVTIKVLPVRSFIFCLSWIQRVPHGVAVFEGFYAGDAAEIFEQLGHDFLGIVFF